MEIIVACEESQAICIALRNKGHNAYSCDILDCSGGHPEWHIKDDVLNHLDDGWDMMIGHPVCKYIANSGARWLYEKPGRWELMRKGAEFYVKLRDAPIKKKAIENPIIHKHARKLIGEMKRQIVQPWWFGDKAFKATGFELIGLPDLTPTDKLVPPKPGTEKHKQWSFIHRMPPSKDREKLRSKTFPGMAKAIADQWG